MLKGVFFFRLKFQSCSVICFRCVIGWWRRWRLDPVTRNWSQVLPVYFQASPSAAGWRGRWHHQETKDPRYTNISISPWSHQHALWNLPAPLNASFCKHQTTLLSLVSGRQEFEVLRVHGCVHSRTDVSVNKLTDLFRCVDATCNKVAPPPPSPTRTFRHMDERTTSHLWHKNQQSSSVKETVSQQLYRPLLHFLLCKRTVTLHPCFWLAHGQRTGQKVNSDRWVCTQRAHLWL